MKYSINTIATIIQASNTNPKKNIIIENIFIDSRNIVPFNNSIFFALHSSRRDGHQFVESLYNKGFLAFVVTNKFDRSKFSKAVFLVVENVLDSLQKFAIYHRQQFKIPIIGITGSNGKTIIKEWLYQILSLKYNVARSPRSYNSQIGVPLSIFELNKKNDIAIFEAGISTYNEMEKLEKIINPTLGILTHIGEAHSDGFESKLDKIKEKLCLFKDVKKLIYNADEIDNVTQYYQSSNKKKSDFLLTWSRKKKATLQIIEEKTTHNQCTLVAIYNTKKIQITLPFNDPISIDNCIYCWLYLLHINFNKNLIQQGFSELHKMDMRLQIKKGKNDCILIDDSYSNDMDALLLAINEIVKQANNNPFSLILSDISSIKKDQKNIAYKKLFTYLQFIKPNKVIFIGQEAKKFFKPKNENVHFFKNTETFLHSIKLFHFKNEYILIKGIRTAEFEKITEVLEEKLHNTIVEINLTAIKNNVNLVQASLPKNTKLICVLKAFGYGTGGIEIAKTLQQESIAYIAVAYIDEAIELRLAGITTPIILLHVAETNFKQMVAYQIEPEIFSLDLFICFQKFLINNAIQHYPVHIKINTGMNRLGFELNELNKLGELLKNKTEIMVKTVFSHLAEPTNKPFSLKQINKFKKSTTILQNHLNYSFYKHILSTSGILLFPRYSFDFVRLGIGIYGIGNTKNVENPIHIYTTISQIKKLKVGENIGYGCTTITTKPTTIAIVQIGYADGYRRNLGNGIGRMYLKNHYAPTMGNICMDLTMIDISHIPNAVVGDKVEVMGNHVPITEIAEKSNTITYEILTNIGKRIKRVYVW